jgi:translation initiation factor 1 (eIF-1/SUI1)
MNQTSDEENKIDLIDQTHPKQIMTDSIPKTWTTTQGNERKQIIHQSQEEKGKSKENDEDKHSFSLVRMEIRREQLIKSERKRFGIELTLITGMTRRTQTKKILRSLRISFQTKTFGTTMRTLIELIIVEKTFHSRLILGTNTKINIVTETQSRLLNNTDLMISNW